MQDSKKILVTGSAGFIGFHLVASLLAEGYIIIGFDSINSYYDISLKTARLRELGIMITNEEVNLASEEKVIPKLYHSITNPNFSFYFGKLEQRHQVDYIFEMEAPKYVINLAAQAGVRYSLTNPRAYIASNVVGFLNILEACRETSVKHLLFASSSSVYGLNTKLPFSTYDNTDHPISLYGATKKSNELMAHSYAHLFGLPTTGLRFFTVYGPWGRPDMALYTFTKSITEGRPIELFNNGDMIRDFTYIDDITESIKRLLDKVPHRSDDINNLNNPSSSTAPYQVFNIGNNKPVNLRLFLTILEEAIGKPAIINSREIQPGDVYATQADVDSLISLIDYAPSTPIKTGVQKFVSWYKTYYQIN
jgi:UDP-glucuronate 4-epimerase